MEITIDGRSVDLNELDDVLQRGPIPPTIRVTDGAKFMEFTLTEIGGRRYRVVSGSVPAYPGALARQNAMTNELVSTVIGAIKKKFGLAGGRRRATRKARKSRRRVRK